MFSLPGGGANYLCMPEEPQYNRSAPGIQALATIYGVEYEIPVAGAPIPQSMYEHNAPCAVCCAPQRGGQLMIPARRDCPDASWTKEYEGALMTTANSGHYRTMYVCVDADAESVPGSSVNTNPAVFYHVEAACNGLPCPPYEPDKELLCVVCTK